MGGTGIFRCIGDTFGAEGFQETELSSVPADRMVSFDFLAKAPHRNKKGRHNKVHSLGYSRERKPIKR